jgi:hypothetical protein
MSAVEGHQPETDRPVDAAFSYAARGWREIPVHGVTADGECACGEGCDPAGKRPHLLRWASRASTDAAVIESWSQTWPTANVGIVTGRESGLVVLDVDPCRGGDESLREIREQFWLPETLTVCTGGGGVHLYFLYPVGLVVGSRLPALDAWGDKRGIEVKGNGRYVVAPPSNHASGKQYAWANDAPVAELPDALRVGLLRDSTIRPDDVDPYVWVLLVDETNKVRLAESNRNDALNLAAFRIGRIIDEIDEELAKGMLYEAGRAVGLSAREIKGTVASGLRGGAAKPKTVSAPYANREEALQDLDRIVAVFRAQPWDGTHRSQRMVRVMEALYVLARAGGGPKDFSAGSRSIAVEARTGLHQVTRGLRDLRLEGWLIPWVRANRTTRTSTKWLLRVPPELKERAVVTPDADGHTGSGSTHTLETPVARVSTNGVSILDEAFRGWTPQRSRVNEYGYVCTPGGLGLTRGRIYRLLIEEERTMCRREIADALAVHVRTVKRNLPDLVMFGLVKSDGDDRYRALPVTSERLTEIAAALGVAGVADEQRSRYGWTPKPRAGRERELRGDQTDTDGRR